MAQEENNKPKKGLNVKSFFIGLGTVLGIFLISWILFGGIIYTYKLVAKFKGSFGDTLKYITNIGYDNRIIGLIYCITIVSTSTFSFIIWKATRQSAQVAEKIDQREIKKDKERIKDNVALVYYDLIRGLKYMKNMAFYMNFSLNQHNRLTDDSEIDNNLIKLVTDKPGRLFINEDWPKYLSNIRGKLSKSTFETIFLFYDLILSINEHITKEDNQILDRIYQSNEQKFFNEIFLNEIYNVVYCKIDYERYIEAYNKSIEDECCDSEFSIDDISSFYFSEAMDCKSQIIESISNIDSCVDVDTYINDKFKNVLEDLKKLIDNN